MYRDLGSATLTGGARLDLGVVEAPDADWSQRLRSFLAHKPPPFDRHIDLALDGPLDGLETRFYLGSVDGEPVTQVMIVGASGYGILGHVYTDPGWRRQGAYRHLMAAQMADVREQGITRLTLSTGFGSVAYGIYRRFGFRSVVDGSGHMIWEAEPESDPAGPEGSVAAEAVRVGATGWRHWAALSDTLMRPAAAGEKAPRSPAVGVDEHGSAESSFLELLVRLHRAGGAGARSRIAELPSGEVVGWCHLLPGPLVLGRSWSLDLHARPGYEACLPDLTAGLDWPAEPVVFAAVAGTGPYEPALGAAGFERALGVVASPGGGNPLELWLRRP